MAGQTVTPDVEVVIADLLSRLTLAEKVSLLSGLTFWRLPAIPRIGLREIVMSDGPVGVRGEQWDERNNSLVTPSPTALAATWDRGLVAEVGALLATEARRKSVDVLLAPTLNLHRSPIGGRHFECYSEDPVLAGEIGAAYIRGVQGGGVATTPKHFVANDAETQRQTVDNLIDERTLHEVYLAPFEAAVAAGAWSIMSAYNGVNGTSMTENALLAHPLKDTWGFDGVVISDWFATYDTVSAALAEQDVEMPGPARFWGPSLIEAVTDGRVPEAVVDAKALRVLRLAVRVGALESVPPSAASRSADDKAERRLLRRTASGGMVLLTNSGLLPLAAPKSVAVIGPAAATPRVQGGGSATVFPASVVTPLDGLRLAVADDVEVRHVEGCWFSDDPTPLGASVCTNPETGEPGVLAEMFAADGRAVLRENRLASRIMWQHPDLVEVTSVRLRAAMTAQLPGTWQVGVIGAGAYGFEIDGEQVFEHTLQTDSPDPAAALFEPPHHTVPVELAEGQKVALTARLTIERPVTEIAVGFGATAPRRSAEAELAAAVEAARASEAAIVCVGTSAAEESEGFDRTTLALPGDQDALVSAVASANANTVVVVNSGAPVEMPWRDEVAAVLLCWFPGQEGGSAIADVLFGKCEPGGRLPTTWPAARADVPVLDTTPVAGKLTYAEGLHLGHRAWLRQTAAPAFWFGHGLGYTTWSLSSATVSALPDGGARVSVQLNNTGDRAGRQVVQCYLSKPTSQIDRPLRWLAGFASATLEPGETYEVEIALMPRAFEHWTPDGWQVERGPFEVAVGFSAVDLPVRTQVEPVRN